MGKRIIVGDRVKVTLFNTARSANRKQRVGESFISEVFAIDYSPILRNSWQMSHRQYCRWQVQVEEPGYGKLWVWQYEVRRIKEVV